MNAIEQSYRDLPSSPAAWLVTGSAGFIGSHIIETLLRLGQTVVSMDSFATGHRSNLDEVRRHVGASRWRNHRFMDADIRDPAACRAACAGVDFVLHQAALGSVPRSLADPAATNATNVDGFLNMLVAARDAGVRRFVYASSSSVYGDSAALPKVEANVGHPLSPYAVTKVVNELYAEVFGRSYGMQTIGLRYFNVFGARQDPEGPYAAVIPRWTRAMLRGEAVLINGKGDTSRDFCYVGNAVQANLLAALTREPAAVNQVFNVAVGDRTTLNELHSNIRGVLSDCVPGLQTGAATHGDYRPGDVMHSQADIGKAKRLLGYAPGHDLMAGLRAAMPWYVRKFSAGGAGHGAAATEIAREAD